MGIKGLLPFVKNSCRYAAIEDFSGSTVAVDAYNWLHKGAFSCAEKLVKGEKTDGYVCYCIKQLDLLLESGLKPIMVFDGCNLTSKEGTEKKRRENREKTRQRGKELLCEGKIKEAQECFQRCVDVTPEMAREVIEACRVKCIDCIVAPYEADAQLAYLDKIGMIQLIITEDSDLILFGCNRILFKMDGFGGLLYEKENLPKSFGSRASKFSFEKFRYMCILSGCDYLPSLPGIGLAKAFKFFTLINNMDVANVLPKLPYYLKMPKLTVTSDYIKSFIKANNTFLYQLVFCPQNKTLVPLNPYPEDIKPKEVEYAGKYLPNDLACQLAMGDINFKTMKKFDSSIFISPPVINEDKSMLWGSQPASSSKASNKTAVSAFIFSAPGDRKKRVSVQKRLFAQTIDSGGEAMCTDEELFLMYGSKEVKRSCMDNSTEEDPLADENNLCSSPSSSISDANTSQNSSHTKLWNLPFRRIVKSRFFASETKTETNPFISASKEFEPKSSTNVDCDKSLEVETGSITDGIDFTLELKICSPKKSDKENIAHRFAKKKYSDVKQDIIKRSRNCDNSVIKNELKTDSWIKIIDDETSSATATISSTGKLFKLLGAECSFIKSDFDKTTSKSKKVSKKYLSTKLEDFKFTKHPICKTQLSNSLESDGNSLNGSLEESYEAVDDKLSGSYIVSPFFNPSTASNQNIESENVTTLSNSEECHLTNIQNSLKIEGPFTPQSSQNKSVITKDGKPGKCRTLGLSKNKKGCDKILRKETLLNFNFIRQPKKEEPDV